jgi:hypothetical protein
MRNAPRSAEDLPVNDATSQPPEEFLLKLNIHTTLSPADPAGADEFYKAFGIMMIAWGRLENHFTTCLLTLIAMQYPRLGGQLPMRWADRAKVWRKAFDGLPLLVGLRPKALEFLSEMEEIAKDRHALAHALWDEFNPSEPLSIGAMIIKAKPKTRNGLDIRRGTITVAMVKEVTEKANRLNQAMVPISMLVTRLRTLQQPPPANIRHI